MHRPSIVSQPIRQLHRATPAPTDNLPVPGTESAPGRRHACPRLLRACSGTRTRLPGVCLPDEVRATPEPAPVFAEQGDEFLGVTGPDKHLDVGRHGFPLERLEHDVEVVDGNLLGAW